MLRQHIRPCCRLLILAAFLLTSSAAWAQERVLSPMLAGANQQFCQAGFYCGTLATGHAESRQTEFVRILQQSGIRAIRFPGGTVADLYLHGNDKAMRETLGLASIPDSSKNTFTDLWQFLEFCRQTKIEPIVQLNSVLWSEGDKVYCLVGTDTKPWAGPKVIRDPSKREAAARSVAALVREVASRGYQVRHWEIGNEEYGYPLVQPDDYADVAIRFTRAIRQAGRAAHVWITLGDNSLEKPGNPAVQWAETLLDRLGKSDVAHDSQLGFTLHYSWRSVVDRAGAMVAKHGMTPRFAMTEFHLAGNGDYSDLSPRFGYAIQLVKYLISMAPDPRIEILCIHELLSQNFGILHFNQRSYGPPDMATWDPSLGYRQMPSAQAYGLFGQLLGGTCVAGQTTPSQIVVALGAERRMLVVNEEPLPKEVSWNEGAIGRGTRQFQYVSLKPKPEAGVQPLRIDQTVVETHGGPIAGNSLRLTLPPSSVTYCRCRP
jgi:hypothetical protein